MGSSFSNSPTEASSFIKEVPLSHVLFSWDVRGTSSKILKELNVWNGFAWFDELKAAFLKFPVADKFTGANCDCKKFGYPKCVGRGGGGEQSTIPIQV